MNPHVPLLDRRRFFKWASATSAYVVARGCTAAREVKSGPLPIQIGEDGPRLKHLQLRSSVPLARMRHARNCEELRTRFEGREAIYVNRGALRVRVSNIHPLAGFVIGGDVEEIATPGLGVGLFHKAHLPVSSLIRWKLRLEGLTAIYAQSWGGSFYFAPEIVQAVISFAIRLPNDADPIESYRELTRLLTHDPTQRVFSDSVEIASIRFLKSDLPTVVVQASSGWVVCPYCDRSFKLADPRRWNGERHVTCGQRLIIESAVT